MHTTWELYKSFWAHNGNVAILWHMGFAVMFVGCGVMVFCGDRFDRESDRQHPEHEVFQTRELRRRR
jgi:4-hydroxybenzoate polyprenyltransferase